MSEFESMTVDELAAYKAERKDEMVHARADAQAANAVYNRKVEESHVEAAVEAVTAAAKADGRTPEEQAKFWLSQQYADPGKHILARRFLEQRVVNTRDL